MFGVSVLCVCWSVALADQFACRIRSVSWVFVSEELPLVGDAFARVGAAISERDARAASKVGDSARDKDFVRPRERLDSLRDVDGDAANVVTAQLDFASVEAATHTDADGVERVANGAGAAHRSPRPIEGRQDAIAGGSDLSAAEAFEFAAGEAVVGQSAGIGSGKVQSPSRISARGRYRRTV